MARIKPTARHERTPEDAALSSRRQAEIEAQNRAARPGLCALRDDIRLIRDGLAIGGVVDEDTIRAIFRVCDDAERTRLDAETATSATARFADMLRTYRGVP